VADIPDSLIALERFAELERAKLAGLTGAEYDAQRGRWCAAYEAVQAAITAHADATGEDRDEVQQALKEAMRHAQEDPTVE
jgi:broad specificity phosphatase PhoE